MILRIVAVGDAAMRFAAFDRTTRTYASDVSIPLSCSHDTADDALVSLPNASSAARTALAVFLNAIHVLGASIDSVSDSGIDSASIGSMGSGNSAMASAGF